MGTGNTQPDLVPTTSGYWRTLMGIADTDSVEAVAKKVEAGVEVLDDYRLVCHLQQVAPEFVETISAHTEDRASAGTGV